jgi:putative salt-induced outer membrane protein YdiY
MLKCHTLCALCILLLAPHAGADEVTLINGDVLSGKISKLVDGSLTFTTDLAGEVTVKLEDIDTLSTDEPVTLELSDGSILKRSLLPSGPGTFRIEAGETVQEQEFKVTDISAVNRPPKPKPKWEGALSGGWTISSGNTKSDNQSLSFNAVKRMEKDRLTVGADYGRGTQKDPATGQDVKTEDWWRALAKYDYFFVKKTYAFVNGRYEKDAIAALDRRMVIGGGVGYQIIENDKTVLGAEGGLASLYEKYDTNVDGDTKLSLQLGYNVAHAFSEAILIAHDLSYLPNTERFSDYYLTATAEVVANFTQRFFCSFKTIFNYDTTPATGKGSTDVKYIFGIGLAF